MKRSSRRIASKGTSCVLSGSSAKDDEAEVEHSKRKPTSVKMPNKKKIKSIQDAEKNNNKNVLFQNGKASKIRNEDSSSESDIEDYLQPVDEIDLNSDFFQVDKQIEGIKSFDAIESDIFAGVNRLSDSESEDGEYQEADSKVKVTKRVKKRSSIKAKEATVATRESFVQIQEYAKQIEEAKKVVQRYEAKRKTLEGKQNDSLKANEDNLNVSQLLALGERDTSGELQGTSETIRSSIESHSESEKEDWEEVEGGQTDKIVIPKEGLQVNVELPVVMRKKKATDLMASIKRRLNRVRKENQILVHKVHLLCWIAYGNYINEALNKEYLRGMALSLIPTEICRLGETTNAKNLEKIIKWYGSAIENIEKSAPTEITFLQLMKLQIINGKVFNKEMLVFLFICILRALGIECRLVLSFRVATLRPPASELHFLGKTDNDKNKKGKKRKPKRNCSLSSSSEERESDEEIEGLNENSEADKHQSRKPQTKRKFNNEEEKKTKISKSNNEKENKTKRNNKPENNKSKQTKEKSKDEMKKNNTNPQRKTKTDNNKKEDKIKTEKSKQRDDVKKEIGGDNKKSKEGTKETFKADIDKNNIKLQRKSNRLSCKKIPQLDGTADDDDDEEGKNSDSSDESNTKDNVRRLSQRKRILPTYEEPDSDEDFVPSKTKTFKKSEPQKDTKEPNVSKPIKSKASKSKKNVIKRGSKDSKNNEDSDYTPETSKKQNDDSDDQFYANTEIKIKQKLKSKRENGIKEVKDKKGIDVWIEVYAESEKRWISADVIKRQVNCASELYSRASHPITYIIAWNNNNTIKDVTQRYCPNCNTVTRKLRIHKKWWDEAIEAFEDEDNERNKKEDEELMRMQTEKPLPTTISEYKNHPLYALKRHLLKFQALYPPEPAILGYVRKEAVYPRECVHTLYSREKWIKEAKVVKPGEKAYKIVFRPTWDKINRVILKNQPLEIFGAWQVQDYEPPTAENGIVPRNEYGNVELFKPCMLPKGCVHIELDGLSKLARKMGIDCAPAITGFDVSHGWIHPVYEGYVVCEEYEDVLVAAWHLEEEELEKREEEKLEKRVYGNWKKLIKGLLIRERLNAKYNFTGPTQSDKTTASKKRKQKETKKPSKRSAAGKKYESNSESDDDADK